MPIARFSRLNQDPGEFPSHHHMHSIWTLCTLFRYIRCGCLFVVLRTKP